jgi:xylulokinase
MDVPRPGWAEQDADAVWWADVCTIAGQLVASVPSGDRIAGVGVSAIGPTTGLPGGIPVVVGTIDALAEGLSVRVSEPGDLMTMYGSTTFFILVTEAAVEAGSLWLTVGAERGQWALAAGLATGGSALAWFRDQLAADLLAEERSGGTSAFAALSSEAASAEAAGEDLLFLPYFSGERTPINDPLARAVAAGLSLGSGRGALYLALLQGIAYATRANLEAMRALAPIRRVVAVGGGTADPLLLQLVSDACGIEQEIPSATIGASRGDALLAGLASGIVGRDSVGAWMGIDRVVRPRTDTRAAHDRRYRAFGELYLATREIVHGLR